MKGTDSLKAKGKTASIWTLILVAAVIWMGFAVSGCAKKQMADEPNAQYAMEPGAILNPKLTRHVDWMLQKIEATETQRKQIKANLNILLLEMGQISKSYRSLSDQMIETFQGDQATRQTFDVMRSQSVQCFDNSSRKMADAIYQIYSVLTPEQRREVAELWDRKDER